MPPMETGAAPVPSPQGQPQAAAPALQLGRLDAAKNNPAAMEAFKSAQISYIEGDKEAGNAHLERFKQLSKLTDDEIEVMRALDDPNGFGKELKALKRAGSSAAEPAFNARTGTLLADHLAKLNEQAATAEQGKADLHVAKQMMQNPDVYMGTFGDETLAIKKFGATVLGMDFQGVADAEVIQRVASKIGLGLRQETLPGPMSDGDRKFLLALPPGLADTPEAARRLVELGIAQKEWMIARAEAANAYVQKHGTLDTGFYRVQAQVDAEAGNRIGQLSQQLQQLAHQSPTRSPTAGMHPRVSTKVEFDALPSGAFFTVTGPDGTSMTKQKP
jgi:hypothetical protein